MENIKTTVCANFNRLVDSSGLTKREIAQQMNISEATLQRWKSGISYPELQNIEKLATVLKVSPYEFYRTNEEPVTSVSKVLKKFASIPDEVYELAQNFGPEDEVWEDVLGVLEGHLEVSSKKSNGNKKHA